MDGRIFFFFKLPDKRKEEGRVQSNIECQVCYFWFCLLKYGADRMIFGGGMGGRDVKMLTISVANSDRVQESPFLAQENFFIFQVCLNIHSWQVGLKQNCEVENIGFRALWINQSPAISRAPPLHTALCWGRLRLQLHNHLHPCPQTTYCWEGTSCSTQRSKIVRWIMSQSSRKTVMLWSNTV